MSQLQTKLLTDTWVTATWDEYIEIIKQPEYDRAKCYYYNGQLRIEMAAVGPDHADDNGIIVILINLFGIAKGIKMRLLVNTSDSFGTGTLPEQRQKIPGILTETPKKRHFLD